MNRTQLADNDVEALTRALQMTLEGSDRDEAERIEQALIDDGWQSAAESAAHSQQYAALGLSPWERPPCEFTESGDPYRQNRECDLAPLKLLKRMLSHGLSKWEPSPITAVAAKQKRK